MTPGAGPRSVAIIGGGRMGSLHFRACMNLGGHVRVVALVDPDPEVRRRYASMNVPTFARLDGAARAWFDVAIVAAPTCEHVHIVEALSPRPIRVLIEKPCALSAAGFERLARLAGRSRASLFVGFWRRFSPPFLGLREVIRGGSIGTARLALACQWDASPPELARAHPGRTGGIGLDCGVHETDTARWLGLGSPPNLCMTAPRSFPGWVPAGDSDQLVATARTECDVLLSVALSRTAGGIDQIHWKVVGSSGSAEVELGAVGVLRVLAGDGTITEEVFQGDPIVVALERQLRAVVGAGGEEGLCALPYDACEAARPWIAD